MPLTKKTQVICPRKESFEAWMEAGSLARAARYMGERGQINPYTRDLYHPDTVRHAAKRWVLENLDEARMLITTKYKLKMSDRDWWEQVLNFAHEIWRYSPKKFFRFIDETNLEDYYYFYKDWYTNPEQIIIEKGLFLDDEPEEKLLESKD